jgi:hypothetical protein
MASRLESELGKKCQEFTAKDISSVLDNWISAVETLDKLRCEDARKEFSATAMVGFGIDGGLNERKKDFIEVRGEETSNDFIKQLNNRLKLKQKTVIELKQKLDNLQ